MFILNQWADISNPMDFLSLNGLNIVTPIIWFISIYINIVLGSKRLHDLDKWTGYIVLNFIPIINLFFPLYLLFAGGTPGENRFWPQPL